MDVVFDSCVIIRMMDSGSDLRLRRTLGGKDVTIVICEQVAKEVARVRGYGLKRVLKTVEARTGKRVRYEPCCDCRHMADEITTQYNFCHNGDNIILALCRTRGYFLVTYDRMLRIACGAAGVQVFLPSQAKNI